MQEYNYHNQMKYQNIHQLCLFQITNKHNKLLMKQSLIYMLQIIRV